MGCLMSTRDFLTAASKHVPACMHARDVATKLSKPPQNGCSHPPLLNQGEVSFSGI